VSLAHLESKCTNIYDAAEVERVYYPEIEKLLLEFFPDATDALVITTTSLTRTTRATARRIRTARTLA